MKNFKNKKSILEQGGLMIEALAMLGLIAVVTPTMYKKSAERTMEVEDINTSTTIRTLMNAAESYVAANYIQLLNDEDLKLPEDDTVEQVNYKDLELSELAPYLPYKFETENSLYNYGKPKVKIVRSGDSISAFMLFPAKGSEDEGIGQERTVRIASLIGSNGGYVSEKGKEAHGVGGVWSLDESHYKEVFKDHTAGTEDASEKYSIVTASTNVANSSTAGAEPDMTKYLQRTRENNADDGKELWRNAMRTDLYMGLVNNADDSWTAGNKTLYSIQNVNKMIIGAHDEANEYTETEGLLDKDYMGIDGNKVVESGKLRDNYGLFIFGSGTEGKQKDSNKTYGNAFINGSIEALRTAANKTLFNVYYQGGDMGNNSHLTFDGTNFELGKASDDMYAVTGDVSGANKKVNVFDDTVAVDAGTANNRTIKIMDTAVAIDENGGDARKIEILGGSGDKTIQIHEAKDAGTFDGKALVAVTTGDTTAPTDGKLTPDKYNTVPDFGVDVDGNMVVQGILAAGQLDVNKIRANKLSVGSKKIDDAYKWMDVDENGVHIHEPNSGYTAAKPGTQVEVKTNLVALRAGDAENKTDKAISSHPSQIVMSEDGIVEKVQSGKLLSLAADKLGVNMKDDEIKFGNLDDVGKRNTDGTQYLAEFGEGANVDIKKGNLKVSDGDKPVFTVRGNDSDTKSGITDAIAGTDASEDYQVAAHGNTVITDKGDNVRYLAMGPADTDAAVNIIKGTAGASTQNARGILTIDMDPLAVPAYTSVGADKNYTTTETARDLDGGSIYIRRGLIDIAPDASYSENEGAAGTKDWSADDGRGVIRASRFVANNITKNGDRVMVPQLFEDDYYSDFNGADGGNRYDTYMVNPAYTSVMNDIKLVSRSGARLSDILPNFITKGMFVATNTWTEDMVSGTNPENFTLTCTHSTTGCKLSQYVDGKEDREGNAFLPASPVIGTVPAPQCPPGYQKVIQVTPARISMAQAGVLKPTTFSETTFTASGAYARVPGGDAVDVTDFNNIVYASDKTGQVPDDADANDGTYAQAEVIKAAFNNLAYANPKYQRLFKAGGDKCKTVKTVTDPTTGASTQYCADYESYDDVSVELSNSSDNTDSRYNHANKIDGVNVEYDDYAIYNYKSITKQHRTDGKTDDIDMAGETLVGTPEQFSLRNKDGGISYVLTSPGNALNPVTFQKNTNLYTQAVPIKEGNFGRAWTLLMGFIYPSHSYSSILSTGGLKSGDGYLWNVFPVDYNSLEAYVTTYCYWDSFNIKGHVTDDEKLPNVNTLDFYPTSQEPVSQGSGGDKDFRQKLNDPAMKYNELW